MSAETNGANAVSDALMDEAMEWFVRCTLDESEASDRQRLELWLQRDEAHRAAYELADLHWQKLAQLPRSQCSPEWFAPHAAASPVPKSAPVNAGGVRWWVRPWRWGSVAAAAAVFAAILTVGKPDPSPPTVLHTTQVAEVKSLTLDDGTALTLGAETALEVTYTPTRREVTLTKGEVFFDVASNPKRPFTVSGAGLSIFVVGTSFEVSRSASSIDVAVVEGIVSVAITSKPSGESSLRLTHAQRVKASGGVLSSIEPVGVDAIGAWREGELAYVSAPLSEILSDADRYYDGDVVLMDASLADLSLSLILDAGDIEGLLNTLESALPLRISRLQDGTILVARSN